MKVIRSDGGEIMDIELDEDLLRRNRELAEENRRLFDECGIRAVDVMGSVGSGKTSLLVQLAKSLGSKFRMAALAGDLATSIDAQRLREADVHRIRPGLPVIKTDCLRGEGVGGVIEALGL